MNTLFPMSVFRLEVARHRQVPAERLRLWVVTPENEQLVDLLRTAPEQHLAAGSVLRTEVALPDGTFPHREEAVSEEQHELMAQASKRAMHSPPPPGPGVLPSRPPPSPEAVRRVPPPAARTPPSQVPSEEEQLRAAMALSLQTQSSALEKEEALMMALAARGKKMRTMRDDGSCLFRALADQLGDGSDHVGLRREVVEHMAQHPDKYAAFCPDDWESYVATMAVEGEYGTHLELQAFADKRRRKVLVHSDQAPEYPPTVIGEENEGRESGPPLEIAFLRGSHYNSVVPIDARDEVAPDRQQDRAMGAAECPVCSQRVSDPDLHMALTHPEMF